MLHLALTGNILSALDSPRELYKKSIIPRFPSEVPYENVIFHLDCANKAALECFLKVNTRNPSPCSSLYSLFVGRQIESPFTPSPILSPNDEQFDHSTERAVIDHTYQSIGMFYEDLKKGRCLPPCLQSPSFTPSPSRYQNTQRQRFRQQRRQAVSGC